jgi:acetyltransferase-like isoleucine patch superfamily enzyme
MSKRRPAGVMVDRVAAAHASYHVARYRMLARFGAATFQQAAEAVGKVPLFYGYRVRQSFYERLLARCGAQLEMNLGSTVSEPSSRIGDRVWIGPGCFLDCVDIGDDVMFGPHVVVLAAGGNTHRFDLPGPVRSQGNNPLAPTRIGEGAWIGANAVVMADVGDGAVVGAGAVVTEPVAPRLIVAGNPARQIGQRPAVA